MTNKINDVLVIGAGVAGLQTARDLAERGYNVHLVEKQPYIGGKIMQLDETFPVAAVSESCSLCYPLCYMLPEISKIYLNRKINVHTYSEVGKVEGKSGAYSVEINKKARYVDPEKCNGCGQCAEVCPVDDLLNEFNYGLDTRRAIHQPLPGSVYPEYIIDINNCLQFKDGSCEKCLKECKYDAINFSDKSEIKKIEVSSIVVATGYEQIKPEILTKYGTEYPNVLTSMQFERMNSINGPTGGLIKRPSDDKVPKSIGFIQCVGSRENGTPGCVSYCSTVCCMYSSKEALNVKRKKIPECECSIFNTEKRGYGKQYYDMIIDAKENWGVNYVDGRITLIKENPENNNLVLRYEDVESGKYKKEEVEMVVLAAGLTKTVGKSLLAQLFGSTLDENGLFSKDELKKLEQRSIFVAGFARYPMNVPDSVTDGSAVAARIAEMNPIPLEAWEAPEEDEESESSSDNQNNSEDGAKIGIFYCEFQDKISKVIDFTSVIKETEKIPGVIFQKVIENAYSPDGRAEIQSVIKNQQLNRIIFTAGSPRYYEDYFKELVSEGDFDPSLIEIIDLREQNAYIHSNEPNLALEKSIELIKQTVNKVRDFKALSTEKYPVIQEICVIADDKSGILCANSIAKQGVHVHLILQNENMEVTTNQDHLVHSTQILDEKMSDALKTDKNETVSTYKGASIKRINGYAGNFTIILDDFEHTEIKVGSIVISGGTKQAKPAKGQFGYGKNDGVYTQEELQTEIDSSRLSNITRAIFILCANQRLSKNNEYRKKMERRYGDNLVITSNCSNVCCSRAIQQAYELKEQNDDIEVFILYRDMQLTGGIMEEIYRKSKREFIYLRYAADEELKPVFTDDNENGITIRFHELNSDSDIEIKADILTLATPTVVKESITDLSEKIKIRREKHGFLQEEHSKVLPFNSTKKGVFLCGSSQWPSSLDLEVSQALAAAMQAVNFVSKGYVESLAGVAHVKQDRCIGCGRCLGICPYDAISFEITFKEYVFGMRKIRKATINPILCEACGLCVSECPVGTIEIPNSNDGSLKRLIQTYNESKDTEGV